MLRQVPLLLQVEPHETKTKHDVAALCTRAHDLYVERRLLVLVPVDDYRRVTPCGQTVIAEETDTDSCITDVHGSSGELASIRTRDDDWEITRKPRRPSSQRLPLGADLHERAQNSRHVLDSIHRATVLTFP